LVKPNDIENMPTATTHDDSLLFAGAFALCVTLTAEVPTRKNKLLCAVVLPLLLWAMKANNRRIVWVELALALVVLFLVMPTTALKRKIVRWAIVAAPLVAVYLAVGWDQRSGPFRGAAVVRSIVEPKTDLSSLWREQENEDLIVTLESSPLLGLGFGHKYIGPVEVGDVYMQEHYLPHNSVLGIWAFGGVVGFALHWTFLVVGAFMASRTYKLVTRPIDRVASVWVLQMLMIYMDHAFGDIGIGIPTAVLLLGAGMAMVGKLTLASGAWPVKVKTSPRPYRSVQGAGVS
jgi:O-antigen ligase